MTYLKYILNNHEIIILFVFSLSLLIQLIFYFGIYFRIIFHKKNVHVPGKEAVSVIICARNEAENLEVNLPFILEQDYPDYEVIVVNDCSNDNTEIVLTKYQNKYKNLKITNILEDKKFTHGKKLALTVGIKAAKNDIILLTDADCKPLSNKWIEKIANNFNREKSIVLGYGKYSRKKGFLNSYIRFDTMWIALQYFCFAMIGKPYMGVGRNLAYRKSLFFEKKGFANHYHILSGDDDLFINENATKENTAIEYSLVSHTESIPKKRFNEWFNQKKRHLSTGKYYKGKHKFLIGTEFISRVLFYVAFVWLMIIWFYPQVIIPAFLFRLITQLFLIKKLLSILGEKNLLLSSLFFDIYSIFINFSLYITGRFRVKKQQWK